MVKWTPKSEKDLEEILIYIAENFTIELAAETVNSIIDYTEDTLSSNPLAGRLLESNPLFSKLTYEGNSIYYCENPKDKNLYIVYVHARQMDSKDERINRDEVGGENKFR